MLSLLHIENIAVIESADISFDGGFTVLTGETGAGKSIVIDAISAILGERAYRDMIRTGANKATVRAVFTGVPKLQWFDDNGVEYDPETIVQREIFLDGKNVCRVNGSLVTVSILRKLGIQLIVSIALLFAFCGICAMLDVSPLLGCMSMGMVYINLTDDKRLFQQLNYFSPPILLLFFVRSGLNFDLDALVDNSESIGTTPLVVVGILYFLVRIVGKYAGAFLGCLVTKKDKKVRNFLGLALIPQAGVAIGLAATGARTLGGEVGNALETIILASSVLYELIGPACAKLSLYLSGSYSNKLEDLAPIPATEPGQPPKSEVELLIERIQAIQQELPKHNNPYYEDEQAFTEAAAEHSAQMEAFFGTPGKANTAMPGRKRK